MATSVQNPAPALKGAVGQYKELATDQYERAKELDSQTRYGAVSHPE